MDKTQCSWCDSTDIRKDGVRRSEKDNRVIAQRYKCNYCGKLFSVSIEEKKEKEEGKINTNYKYEEKQENATIESPSFTSKKTDRVKILDDFLELCQVDLNTWEVEKYTLNAWDVTMSGAKSSTGVDSAYTNYQIKVWLKRKIEIFDKEKFTKELVEDVKKNHAPQIKSLHGREDGKYLYIPNLYDVHLGRLCWHEETGANYDINIAYEVSQKLIRALFDNLFNAPSSKVKLDRILFPVGNDFFNYDYAEPYPMTTNQTPQEADVRWQKMFRVGRNLLYSLIDWMSTEIAPVDVVVVPGNHEEQTMWYLGEVLSAKYENNNNVSIDNRPVNRKYYQYGKNLLGFAHGKNEKDVELHNLMSLEAPTLWADTKYRYYYLGHNHHERSLRSKTSKAVINQEVDYKGVMISYLPSAAQTDKYEHKKGYEGSVRGARGMLHDYYDGRKYIIGENI